MSARDVDGFGALIPSPDECAECEYGLIEYLVEGSAGKTEMGFCLCALGRARQASTQDALEAKGGERAR